MIHSDDFFKDTLISLQDTFQDTAIELMDIMFEAKTAINEPWVVSDSIEGTFDYIFRLICKNKLYKSNTIIGASMEGLQNALGKNCTLEYAKDAFGEFANCYNAMLMNEPLFLKHFDVMFQEIPEDATTLACFPLAWGIHGLLRLKTESIFLRFSIEDIKFSSELFDVLD